MNNIIETSKYLPLNLGWCPKVIFSERSCCIPNEREWSIEHHVSKYSALLQALGHWVGSKGQNIYSGGGRVAYQIKGKKV